MILVTKWFGVFLCEGEEVRRYKLFEKDPKLVARKLAAVQRGEVLPEERELAVRRMKVADPRLKALGKPAVFDSSFIRPEAYGLTAEHMQRVMLELGKIRVREPLSEDRSIAQAIRATDDLIEEINLLSERLHEWYGVYFPELGDLAKDAEYARLVCELGERQAILEHLGVALESVGTDLVPRDLEVVQGVARTLLELYRRKEALDAYILEGMERVAPNLSALLSPNLAARLIALAGGLQRLARLPSSTVQLLGAEKALFLHLRSGKRPPKHGVIFQHPWVNRSPYWQRGKVARSLGAKISIAARVDAYHGEPIADQLKEQMERRIAEIRERYPDPPRRERSQQRPGQGHQRPQGRRR
ncbi:MAG: ribosomal biogenesis protein [Methanomassiliicoccales archaeon]|jgi:nucleolar protein 56|nr:ribosomal biogenesis protein [Methanomassiliicoccales archaeon]